MDCKAIVASLTLYHGIVECREVSDGIGVNTDLHLKYRTIILTMDASGVSLTDSIIKQDAARLTSKKMHFKQPKRQLPSQQ